MWRFDYERFDGEWRGVVTELERGDVVVKGPLCGNKRVALLGCLKMLCTLIGETASRLAIGEQ